MAKKIAKKAVKKTAKKAVKKTTKKVVTKKATPKKKATKAKVAKAVPQLEVREQPKAPAPQPVTSGVSREPRTY